MIVTCCSDLHNGPTGHPATDATPGWLAAWAAVEGEKLRLGDMDELLQFTRSEIQRKARGGLASTDVAGNHDMANAGYNPGGTATAWECWRWRWLELLINDTIFLHGHQFDPWWARVLGRPAAKAARVLEFFWPDADVKLAEWARRKSGLGRHGEADAYAQRAAEYAAKRSASQIVFGHLHQRFERWVVVRRGNLLLRVHVVCTGCCCNGRMDFVEVEV